jgi:lysyl oxidase
VCFKIRRAAGLDSGAAAIYPSSSHPATTITTSKGSRTTVLLNLDGTLAIAGHKQAFCFLSDFKYSNALNGQDKPNYTCQDQGIASGYGDWYYKQLSGQWIDITGVPEGDYIVHVRINAAGTFPEGENRYPNVIQTRLHVPDPRNKVALDASALQYGK